MTRGERPQMERTSARSGQYRAAGEHLGQVLTVVGRGVGIAALLRKNATLEELIIKKNGLTSQGVQVGPQPQV